MAINQAVLFSKPLHHLDINLTSEELNLEIQNFFQDKDIYIRFYNKINGKDLGFSKILNKHYGIYDYASSIDSIKDLVVSKKAKIIFEDKYNIKWDEAIESRKLNSIKDLKERYKFSSRNISDLWNDKNNNQVVKLQPGLVISYIFTLDIFLINGFFPLMIDLFYNPNFTMDYYIVDFDFTKYSWLDFRRSIVGKTDASKADVNSFRGKIFSKYEIENPMSNNFIHGSAGPFEGFIERMIHEQDFDFITNPIGTYLDRRGISLDDFKLWHSKQSIAELSELFDLTEEKNTDEAISLLGQISFD